MDPHWAQCELGAIDGCNRATTARTGAGFQKPVHGLPMTGYLSVGKGESPSIGDSLPFIPITRMALPALPISKIVIEIKMGIQPGKILQEYSNILHFQNGE